MLPVSNTHSPLPPTLHPWAVTDPQEQADSLNRQASKYNVLSKITFVAIAAIGLFSLAISFTAGAATGTLPIILFSAILITAIAGAIIPPELRKHSKNLSAEAEVEQKTATQFTQIRDWWEDQIDHFLRENGVALPRCENVPPLSYLYLIARFKARQLEAIEMKKQSDIDLKAKGYQKEGDEVFRTHFREKGWNELVDEAMPAVLEAALILQILSQPALQAHLSDLGRLKKKTFTGRSLDKANGPDDVYFRLADRRGITYQEVMDNLENPQALRLKLFPLTAENGDNSNQGAA